MTTLSLNGLSVDQQLAQFVEQQLLPGTGLAQTPFGKVLLISSMN